MNRFRSPKTGPSIALYIIGIALLVAAILIILNGMGVLSAIPPYVFVAVLLIVIGAGILGGLRSSL